MTDSRSWYGQSAYDVRCEWGMQGMLRLAPISDVVVVVDVLSFSTSVAIAVDRGAIIYPYAGPPSDLAEFAATRDAGVAGMRDSGAKYSLSPQSLVEIPAGARLVLPSPNGSTLSMRTGDTPAIAGCLRNSLAVAEVARRHGPRVAVIPAGERWRDGGGLRPSFEDLVGAGAVIRNLPGTRSPEAQSAVAAFLQARHDLLELLLACGSGVELAARGSALDVALAAELDVLGTAPVLSSGAYRAVPA